MASLIEILEARAWRSRKKSCDYHSWPNNADFERYHHLRKGYVYLFHIKRTHFYKIGMSTKPNERITSVFGAQPPFVVTIEHIIETDDMAVVESSLQQFFAHRRIHKSEFFYLEPRDVDMIKVFKEITIHPYRDVSAILESA